MGVALAQRLGIPSEASEPADTAINDALATPALDEHGSAEARACRVGSGRGSRSAVFLEGQKPSKLALVPSLSEAAVPCLSGGGDGNVYVRADAHPVAVGGAQMAGWH